MHPDTPLQHPEAGIITGPHPGYDRYGRLDHYYWRCERCDLESTAATVRHGCWRCEGEDG